MSVLDDIMLALLLEKPVTQCVSWGSLRGGCAVTNRASVSHVPGLRGYSAHVLSCFGNRGAKVAAIPTISVRALLSGICVRLWLVFANLCICWLRRRYQSADAGVIQRVTDNRGY